MLRFKSLVIGFFSLFLIAACHADDVLSLFPIENYDQQIATWIKPTDPDYDKPLLSSEVQQARLEIFYKHFFGASSPWNADYVNQILHHNPPDDLKTLELGLIELFDNQGKPDDKIGYGENYRPYSKEWINDISNNINFSQLEGLSYSSTNRAITIDNVFARVLPTDDVNFNNYKIAGQGFPFDNLQMSSVWAGTPLYILGETKDHAWTLVITPDFIAWVKTLGLARVSDAFVGAWQMAAKDQLAAITQTKTSIVDSTNTFRFLAYVGTVFPAKENSSDIQLMIPVMGANQQAEIKTALVSKNNAAIMPLVATPHNFSRVMSTLIGRPYGWGNMYFYNDCSSELKNLFTAFGIWLPRHSSDQVYAGKMVDLSAEAQKQRLNYLMENGHRFLTIIYIGGHIVLYVGNYPNPHSKDQESMAMLYEDMWGLSPNPPVRRAVIGKSVLFPMLEQFPEDTSLMSQAGKKYFQMSQLDETPNNLMKLQIIDLKALMYP